MTADRKRGPQFDTQRRLKAIAEIIAQHGTTSPSEILDILKTDYGIETTRQTITADLKKDLDSLDEEAMKNKKMTILGTIEELAEIAANISKNPNEDSKVRLAAMNTYSTIIKTQAEVLKRLQEARSELNQAERPVHNIYIGEPKAASKEELANVKKIDAGAGDNDSSVKKAI